MGGEDGQSLPTVAVDKVPVSVRPNCITLRGSRAFNQQRATYGRANPRQAT